MIRNNLESNVSYPGTRSRCSREINIKTDLKEKGGVDVDHMRLAQNMVHCSYELEPKLTVQWAALLLHIGRSRVQVWI
jgi:hypothetical protein